MTEVLKIHWWETPWEVSTQTSVWDTKRSTAWKILHAITDHPDLIAAGVIWMVAFAAAIQYGGKKLFDINILEIVQESPSSLHARIKCDQTELYIRKDGNRIICYKSQWKAQNEVLKTPGIPLPTIRIPEIKFREKVYIEQRSLGGGTIGWGYTIKEYEPWWNHQVVVMDGFSTVYEWNYGDYVKQTPWCSITVTWNGVTQVLKDFDFKNFTKWTQQMDACRSQVEWTKK